MKIELPKIWRESLTQQRDISQIIKELIAQIIKDFSMFGEELHFNEEAEKSYQYLYGQLEKYLRDGFSSRIESLYPILYRIDILEKDIKKAMTPQKHTDFLGEITELIIIKELQKVIIKRYYQSKS
ncbi:MAG: hypothetical protein V4683_09975 [Bacteroidota bacterium]